MKKQYTQRRRLERRRRMNEEYIGCISDSHGKMLCEDCNLISELAMCIKYRKKEEARGVLEEFK